MATQFEGKARHFVTTVFAEKINHAIQSCMALDDDLVDTRLIDELRHQLRVVKLAVKARRSKKARQRPSTLPRGRDE